MRPRERENTASPPPSSPPPAAAELKAPPSPITAPSPAPTHPHALSSLVVRPADNDGDVEDGGGSGGTRSTVRREKSLPFRRRESSPQPLRGPRRGSPPPAFRHRDVSPAAAGLRQRRDISPTMLRQRRDNSSPGGFRSRRDVSPPPQAFRRRGNSPHAFQSRTQRFGNHPGYGMRAGSISPPHHRRLDYRFETDFDRPARASFGRGTRGGRGDARFQDVSPRYVAGRGGSGRGYGTSGRRLSPFGEGDFVNRNDPNLSPREGDWICQNPSCGNLNFARRENCFKCNQWRFASGHRGLNHSPRRGYFNSPSPYRSPPRFSDRTLRRDVSGYKSPPRNWPGEDPRDFRAGSSPRRGRRLSDDGRRDRLDYQKEDMYGDRRNDLPGRGDWDPRDQEGNGFISSRRGFDRHTPSPRGRWARDGRDRSRSPVIDRQLPYIGRGRGGDRWRYDDQYIGRGRGRGGYPRVDDPFTSRGRGDRRNMLHGSNGDVY